MLTALRVVVRNSVRNLQGALARSSSYPNAVASELLCRCRSFSGRAHRQRCVRPGQGSGAGLMGFFWPGAVAWRSPADWHLHHCGSPGQEQRGFHTMDFGASTAACLEAGHHIRLGKGHIRHPGHGLARPPWINLSLQCSGGPPAVSWTAWLRAHRGAVPDPSAACLLPWPPISPVMRSGYQRWSLSAVAERSRVRRLAQP